MPSSSDRPPSRCQLHGPLGVHFPKSILNHLRTHDGPAPPSTNSLRSSSCKGGGEGGGGDGLSNGSFVLTCMYRGSGLTRSLGIFLYRCAAGGCPKIGTGSPDARDELILFSSWNLSAPRKRLNQASRNKNARVRRYVVMELVVQILKNKDTFVPVVKMAGIDMS